MEHKNRIVSFTCFVKLLCFYCMVGFMKASMSVAIQDSIKQRDVCSGLIGTNRMTKKKKGPCPTLVVWVPKKEGFTEFVKVNKRNELIGGFSIAIFCKALDLLPFDVQPIFKPFINEHGESNGTYDKLVEHIKDKTCEAAAGDITIRSERTQYVNFTIPYLSSEVYMLVHGAHEWNQALWIFLRPFTWRLWITIVGMCIVIGVAIAILEYRAGNPKFETRFYRKVILIIWFPISTFVFNEGKILNGCSKVVLVMWLCMICIVAQIFTATLSSWLTLDQLRPRVPSSYEKLGYQGCSFVKDFIVKEYNCSEDNIVALKNVKEYKMALSNGSVSAVFDELPYIELFLARYGSDYMKWGPIKQESGLAFAFPYGSPLLDSFSKAIIEVTEDGFIMKMKKKYLGIADKSQLNQAHPKSLDVQSFIGLFVFMGSVTLTAIIWSEIFIMRTNNKVRSLISEPI